MAAFNVAAFRPLDEFKKDVAEFARHMKSAARSDGSSGVFYPGEIGYLREQERTANGIEI
ncbi:Ldh family oxidoreductase [Bradyrhizobium sp. CAR08]